MTTGEKLPTDTVRLSGDHGAYKIVEAETVLTLPYPPTANHIWKNGAGRTYKSAKYREWQALALAAIAQQKPPLITGPYGMAITAWPPDRRKRDISNIVKPTEDILRGRVIVDDNLCQILTVGWLYGASPSKDEARVQVTIARTELHIV